MIRKLWLKNENGYIFEFTDFNQTLITNVSGFGASVSNTYAEYENNYKKILKIIRETCEKNGHKYDDGVSALVRGRYGYNDYRYKCQICGVEIPDK